MTNVNTYFLPVLRNVTLNISGNNFLEVYFSFQTFDTVKPA